MDLLRGFWPSFQYRFVIFLALSCLPFVVHPQVPEKPKPSDVRIVIDISGSMKKNDPENLRRPALDMLVNLISEDSRGGVWTFGQYVNMLVKHGDISSDWKKIAVDKAQTINSVAQFTNIGEALENAAYDRNYSTKDDHQTHVILLTDGMVDIDRDPQKNSLERQRILEQVLPEYQKAGYKIHTIALSDKADQALMDRLAVATGGQSVVANSAEALMSAFLKVFDQAVPAEELPLEGNSFVTDSSIEEFTALIFRETNSQPTQLISPDQSRYNQSTKDANVSWYSTDQYDLITVKRPLEGEWRIAADLAPNSRVTVVSDLSLAVKPIPGSLLNNEVVNLSVALREENKVVDRAEFLKLLDIDLKVHHLESDTQWEQRLSEGLIPGNGVYKTQMDYFKEDGEYKISIQVDGKSFQRQYNRVIQVREPFSVNKQVVTNEGQTRFEVEVLPNVANIDFDKTEVVGKLKSPSGSSNIVRLTLTDQQSWKWQHQPDAEGQYVLTLRITQNNGIAEDYIPPSVSFQYPESQDDFFSDLEKEVEPISAIPSIPTETEKPEPAEDVQEVSEEEALLEEEKKEQDFKQWILYGVLGVVNLLIILVVYLLYRKLFSRSAVDEVEADGPAGTEAQPVADEFEEPPMDEMNINELDDEEEGEGIDLEDEEIEEQGIDMAEELDPLEELTPEALDDDEEPEFSLDDFAPDALDDDDEVK